MSDRRAFLVRLAAGIVAAGSAAGRTPVELLTAAMRRVQGPAGGIPPMAIGIQLYTVREAMATAFEGTLERLAGIGYDEVEFAGYFGRTPAEVRSVLDGVGLAAPAAHVAFEALRDELDRTLEVAASVGHGWVVCPWLPESERTPEGYRRLAALLNRAGAAARCAGLRVAYHNHEFEFDPLPGAGTLPLELLLDRTDPELVDFELDLYWAARVGHDPRDWFRRHPGRFPLVHVKDMDGSPERRMVDPGKGVIDFPAIAALREQAGIRHWFVEHDQPEDPFGTARVGLEYLRGIH